MRIVFNCATAAPIKIFNECWQCFMVLCFIFRNFQNFSSSCCSAIEKCFQQWTEKISSNVSFSEEIHRKWWCNVSRTRASDDCLMKALSTFFPLSYFFFPSTKKLCESHSSFHILYFLVLHSHTNQFYFVVVNKRMLYLVIVLHITTKNICIVKFYSSCSC